jgi:hypothetical protein
MTKIAASSATPFTETDTHARAQAKDWENNESDDATSLDTATSESPIRFGKTSAMLGHSCAAGCGHFCWVTAVDYDDA